MTAGNPFEAADADEAPYLPPQPLLDAWQAGCQRLLIWGANGMGKSRALAAWAAWTGQTAPPVRAPANPCADSAWWLLDEAQHHHGPALRREVRAALGRGQSVAIASHLPHRWALRGLGYNVVRLTSLADDHALAELVEAYLRPAEADWRIAPAALAAWRQISGGNRRAALRLGYELYEEHGRTARLTAVDIHAAAAILNRDAPDVLGWRRLERRHRRPLRQ